MNFKLFLLEVADPYAVLGVKRTDDFETIKKAYRKLVRQHHPDNFGDEKEFIKIKTAWDMISTSEKRQQHHAYANNFSDTQSHSHVPDWQTDERSSYNTVGQGHHNINYNKKYIYEKSLEAEGGDRSKLKRMTVQAFDGYFFRSIFTVFGSEKAYPEIAKAMYLWNSHGGNPYRTEAIIVTEDAKWRSGGPSKIIWINGKNVDINIDHDESPVNDRDLTRKLKEIIQQHK